MRQEELEKILEVHKEWINDNEKGVRADLSGVCLREENLSEADLSGANLSRSDLRSAELSGADLSGANLSRADLRRTDISGVDLRSANLSGADLRGANLSRANLSRADLSGANLRSANLSGADLSGANLRGADLDFASLSLWCGVLEVKTDKRIAAQLAYHFCRLDCNDPEYLSARNKILKFANEFHRVDECGRVKVEEERL